MIPLLLVGLLVGPPKFDPDAPTRMVDSQQDVTVTLVQVAGEWTAAWVGSGRILDQVTCNDLNAFELKITSSATDRKRDFRLWSTSSDATLVDDLGNRCVTYRPSNRLHKFAWQHADTRLDSRTLGGDVVVFERAVPAAKWVKLSLPGRNVGLPEAFEFRLAVWGKTARR